MAQMSHRQHASPQHECTVIDPPISPTASNVSPGQAQATDSLGADLFEADATDGAVILGLRLAEPHTNSRGFAHGGFITALADNAMGLSCAAKRSAKTRLITASLSIDFISSAKIGQWIAFETDVLKAGSNLCFAQCSSGVQADDVVRSARASGTFSVVKPRE